jgi:glutathione S-transferase
VDKVEAQLAQTPWLAGDMYTLADINFFSHCGMMLARMFPDIGIEARCPKLLAWAERVRARPAVAKALAGPDHSNPALRTFTGEVH